MEKKEGTLTEKNEEISGFKAHTNRRLSRSEHTIKTASLDSIGYIYIYIYIYI